MKGKGVVQNYRLQEHEAAGYITSIISSREKWMHVATQQSSIAGYSNFAWQVFTLRICYLFINAFLAEVHWWGIIYYSYIYISLKFSFPLVLILSLFCNFEMLAMTFYRVFSSNAYYYYYFSLCNFLQMCPFFGPVWFPGEWWMGPIH